MECPTPNPALPAVLVVIGLGNLYHFSQNLYHFSQNVRLVDVVGLSGGGAACGAAIFSFVFAFVARKSR